MLNCSFTWMTTGSTPSTSSYCLHHYLRHSPPVSHLRLQTHDLCRQPVDLLLRPDDVTEVHLIAVEALMGPWVLWQVRGNRRGGSGWGSSGDWQHCGTDGGGLSRMLQLLEFFLEPALPSLQVTDLHLGTDKQILAPCITTNMSFKSVFSLDKMFIGCVYSKWHLVYLNIDGCWDWERNVCTSFCCRRVLYSADCALIWISDASSFSSSSA